MTKYATAVLLSLLIATTTYGQDEDASLGIELCRWVSILAKEVMTARQKDTPMSETLPFALDRIKDFPNDMGILGEELGEEERAEMLAEFENSFQEMKPIITQLVMGAYEAPAFTYEEYQRTAISEFENATFASCYQGWEEDLAAIDAESNRLDPMAANAKAAYMFAIQQKVERNWVRPPTATAGLECVVNVRQLPGGEVVGVTIGQCNGDAAVQLSIEAAVFKASPLPEPENPALFDRNLRITFKPEQ